MRVVMVVKQNTMALGTLAWVKCASKPKRRPPYNNAHTNFFPPGQQHPSSLAHRGPTGTPRRSLLAVEEVAEGRVGESRSEGRLEEEVEEDEALREREEARVRGPLPVLQVVQIAQEGRVLKVLERRQLCANRGRRGERRRDDDDDGWTDRPPPRARALAHSTVKGVMSKETT